MLLARTSPCTPVGTVPRKEGVHRRQPVSSLLRDMIPPILLDALFWTAAAACACAQYFIVRAVWRVIPSGTSSPDVPVPRRATEIIWVLLPVLLLSGAFYGTWRYLHPPGVAAAQTSAIRA